MLTDLLHETYLHTFYRAVYILYLVLQLISHCLFLYDAAPSPSIAYAESIDIRQLSANVEHRLVNLLEPSSNSTLRSSSNDESRPESNALKIPDITAGQDSEKALGSSVSANKKQHLKESTPQLKRRYHVIFLVILIAVRLDFLILELSHSFLSASSRLDYSLCHRTPHYYDGQSHRTDRFEQRVRGALSFTTLEWEYLWWVSLT